MIATKQRTNIGQKLKDGIYSGYIYSVSEGIGKIIIDFKFPQGMSKLELPINTQTHQILCELAYVCGLGDGKVVKLADYVGCYVDVEIIYGRPKYIDAYKELNNELI